ncbi:MAG: acetylglutamate kinase [Lachnospiraceae bacterium]|jgi:acetylglutamate kinase|nr:acetylglutamate kinase [Lachnospiraceae bacterium]RKJ50631.1 acetylglutamate kinase [bacterium 1XD42-54]
MESTMELWVEKANVLIEALPYIRRFHGKTIVVKYGGSAMIDQELKQSVIRDVALLKLIGFRPIVVHGGGKEITRWINKIGLETNFINGLRVTDKPTMEIVEMVLNKINKDLVSMMQNLGLKAVGISGKDGGILRVDRKLAGDKDIGFVGEVKTVNTGLLDTLLDNDFVPVICPVGFDSSFNSYNVNADDAACAIATAVKAAKLAFLTDIEGVYRDPLDRSSLISELTIPEAKGFLKSGNVGGGMLPKLQNCIAAIEAGVSRVHILDGRIAHCLLLEFFTNKGIGTAIIGDTEERYYSENNETCKIRE